MERFNDFEEPSGLPENGGQAVEYGGDPPAVGDAVNQYAAAESAFFQEQPGEVYVSEANSSGVSEAGVQLVTEAPVRRDPEDMMLFAEDPAAAALREAHGRQLEEEFDSDIRSIEKDLSQPKRRERTAIREAGDALPAFGNGDDAPLTEAFMASSDDTEYLRPAVVAQIVDHHLQNFSHTAAVTTAARAELEKLEHFARAYKDRPVVEVSERPLEPGETIEAGPYAGHVTPDGVYFSAEAQQLDSGPLDPDTAHLYADRDRQEVRILDDVSRTTIWQDGSQANVRREARMAVDSRDTAYLWQLGRHLTQYGRSLEQIGALAGVSARQMTQARQHPDQPETSEPIDDAIRQAIRNPDHRNAEQLRRQVGLLANRTRQIRALLRTGESLHPYNDDFTTIGTVIPKLRRIHGVLAGYVR
jgi:hypothetical protein